MSDCDRLSNDVVRLSQRVRGLEDAEISMQSMCNCVEQLVEEIASLDNTIAKGDFDTSLATSSIANAAHDVSAPKPLSQLVVDAKRLLQQLQDVLSKQRATVKRFVNDRQKTYLDMQRRHQDEITKINKDRDTTVASFAAESTTLRKRVEDLEKEIVNVAEGYQRDVQVEASQRLAALDKLLATNKDLTEKNDQLTAENDVLRTKSKKMKLDWNKVEDSRRRFQQLQAELLMMRQYCEQISLENRNLKIIVDQKTNKSEPKWNSQNRDAFETYNLAQIHRQAFDEWKSTTLQGASL